MLTLATPKAFRPFLVESERYKNIFRVVELEGGATRKQIGKLLENLPISFRLGQNLSLNGESINEPLEVYACGVIVYIYPPRHRVIACTTFDSWRSASTISKMHLDNVMDTAFPGHGQLRTCVHFDPKILGIKNWPNKSTPGAKIAEIELEIDIHVFPKDKEKEPKLKAPAFDKRDVRKLLELIAGGDRRLSAERLHQWRELIMYAVKIMRSCYENPDTPEDYPVRVYYKPCWAEIEAAGEDDKKLIEALENLRVSIQEE